MPAWAIPGRAQSVPPFKTETIRPDQGRQVRPPEPTAQVPPANAEPVSPWSVLAPDIASPPTSDTPVHVRRLELRGDLRRTDILLTISRRTAMAAFALAAPERVVIDGAGLDFSGVVEVPARGRSLVAAPRVGPLTSSTGRLLFDAAGPVRVVSMTGKPVGNAVELTISVLPAGRQAGLAPPIVWGTASDAVPPSIPGPGIAPLPASARPVVMIDPGHGGIDPGAVSDQGILEKDVVLAVALRLRAMLEARGRVAPLMTRQADVTVRLDQRVATAEAQKASLFISLHADTYDGAGSASVRGGSVYVLAAEASNAAARALAEKENTADLRAGVAGAAVADHAVEGILADLTMRETQALSHAMQASLVNHLQRSILLAREPARAAAFRVLKQAETPAVLIELGYMSNGQDFALLQSAEWQSGVAARIADAVDAYFAKAPGAARGR